MDDAKFRNPKAWHRALVVRTEELAITDAEFTIVRAALTRYADSVDPVTAGIARKLLAFLCSGHCEDAAELRAWRERMLARERRFRNGLRHRRRPPAGAEARR